MEIEVNDDGWRFEDWLDEVDVFCHQRFGVSIYEFGAWGPWDCWAESMTPQEGLAAWYEVQSAYLGFDEEVIRKRERSR